MMPIWDKDAVYANLTCDFGIMPGVADEQQAVDRNPKILYEPYPNLGLPVGIMIVGAVHFVKEGVHSHEVYFGPEFTLLPGRQYGLRKPLVAESLQHSQCFGMQSGFLLTGVIENHELHANFFKRFLFKIITEFVVIVPDRKCKDRTVELQADLLQSALCKHPVHHLHAKPGIVEQGTVPVPDDMFVVRKFLNHYLSKFARSNIHEKISPAMKREELLKPVDDLLDCAVCPHECHVNRFESANGICRSDASFNIASICIHKGEEPVISGPLGICNIFFTNCNLQCMYCQNHQISDTTISRQAFRMELPEIVKEITGLLDKGINLVGFVSPSHFVPQMKVVIEAVKQAGYSPKWVYNTNGYDRVETLRSLEGMIDVFLPDFKYMDPLLSRVFSKTANYPEKASAAIKEMYRQKGAALHLSDEGTAESGIVIRHLVLPGQVQNSLGVLRYIADEISPKLHISLMSQYYPTARVMGHKSLGRVLYRDEYLQVVNEMEKLGLDYGWVQGLDSKEHYRPDFEKGHPFE